MGTIVDTIAGRVEGLERNGVSCFRGIPFASPPEGALRFRAPQPPAPWKGVRPAHERPTSAPQNPAILTRMLSEAEERHAEDCLYLNVWTPCADTSRRPVMVWIHGGGFTMGSGSHSAYDGSALARRGDVVVVTLNYRLGAFGFLPLPALVAEDEGAANLGIHDQLAALAWVRDNIAAFGGDPRNVTLFGTSAGAMSVGTLLAVPQARGLFHRAILQSGALRNVHTAETARRVATCFAAELGVAPDDVAALRRASLAEMLAAQHRTFVRIAREVRGLPFQPSVDGQLLRALPDAQLGTGAAAPPPVPILVGTNLDECKLFGLGDPQADSLDHSGLERRCARNLGDPEAARRLVERYRRAREGRDCTSPRELWFAIESDRWFRRPATELAERWAAAGVPVHQYLFTWRSPAFEGRLGACHALEIPFVFGTADHGPLPGLVGQGDAVADLSARMQDAWLGFARNGDPSHAGLGAWPTYEAAHRATMRLGAECRLEHAPYEAERAVWDDLQLVGNGVPLG